MTTKQMFRLQERIASLRDAGRIVWIEGISKEIIKGKASGVSVYFVRAESLNLDGGHWYYIVSWDATRTSWACTCESAKSCKHQRSVNAMLVEAHQAARSTGDDQVAHVEDDLRMASAPAHRQVEAWTPEEDAAYNQYTAPLRSLNGQCSSCGRKSRAATCEDCLY